MKYLPAIQATSAIFQYFSAFAALTVGIVSELAVFRQTESVQIALYVENRREFSSAADLDDWSACIVDSCGFRDHCSRSANAALARFIVTARVHEASVGQEQRVVSATGGVDDVESLQAGNFGWLLVSLQFGLTQLCKVVAT